MANRNKRKPWTAEDKRAAWQASKGRCVACGRRWRLDQHGGSNGWTIDHISAHSDGGVASGRLNGQVMCRPCNQRKGNRLSGKDVATSLGRMTQAVDRLTKGAGSSRGNRSGGGRSGGTRSAGRGGHKGPRICITTIPSIANGQTLCGRPANKVEHRSPNCRRCLSLW